MSKFSKKYFSLKSIKQYFRSIMYHLVNVIKRNIKKRQKITFLHNKIINSGPLITGYSKRYANSASFEVKEYLLHNLDKGPSRKVEVSKEDAIKYYDQMATIRRMEATAAKLYQETVIRGFLHLYSGQEACAVGMKAVMRENDDIIGSYRIHGWCYLMGASIVSILAELGGKDIGIQKGKGGSMHMYAKHFYGGNGIVGAQLPLGTGIAFASKYKGHDGVCFTLYGDGAANQGQVFESYNMAMLWKLPVIYVCENNGYAMGTAIKRHAQCIEMFRRGHYIPGLWVDGMDILAVREASKFCIEHCKSGKGPIVMELATYRYFGHSMSDPGTSYRTHDEVMEVRKNKDPIKLFMKRILDAKLVTEEELKTIDKRIKAECDKAGNDTRKSKELPLTEVSNDVEYNFLGGTVRNILPWSPLKHVVKGEALNKK